MMVIVTLSGIKTIARNADWKNNSQLFLRDIQATHRCVRIFKGAGSSLIEKARTTEDATTKRAYLQQSIEYLSHAISIDSTFAWAYSDLGSAYYLSERIPEAEGYWLKARKIDKTIPLIPIQNQLLSQYYTNLAFQAAKKENYREAIKWTAKVLFYAPENAGIWVNKGVYHNYLQEYDSSLVAFEKAVIYDSGQHIYWHNLGGTYYKMQQYPKARAAWEEALKLKPDFVDALQGIQTLDAMNQ